MSPITTAVRQPARRGRPCGRGVKRWHGEAVARVVRDALAARDVDDPESVTEDDEKSAFTPSPHSLRAITTNAPRRPIPSFFEGNTGARIPDSEDRSADTDCRLCEAVVRPFGDRPLQALCMDETQRLRRLVATARPSEIIRAVHRWNARVVRDALTARVARVLATRSDISELIWA